MPGVLGVQYEVRLTADSSSVTRGRTNQLAAATLLISQNLLPNTAYQVRGQYIPSAPRDMLWSDWLDVTTPNILFTLADFDATVIAMVTGIEQFDVTEINNAINLLSSLLANVNARTWNVQKELTSQISATFETASASIEDVRTVAVDTNTAFAAYQLVVSATFGPSFSTVSTVSDAVATLDGYAASSYSVTLDVNNYATGFELVNGGSGVSSFTVTVDKFQIAAPGVTGGAPVSIFTVANVAGTPKVGLRGDMIVDGSITTQTIAAGSITAVELAANSVTAGAISAGSINTAALAVNSVSLANIIAGSVTNENFATHSTFATVPVSSTIVSVTATIESGNATVEWDCSQINATDGGSTVCHIVFSLFVDGVSVRSWTWSGYISTGNQLNTPISVKDYVTGLSNASHTFTIKCTSSTFSTCALDGGFIRVQDLRR